jgi:proteic killer suppression protein
MIQKFKHKGLKKLFESGNRSGVKVKHAERLRRLLALLETSDSIEDMDLPGLNLHQLKGKRKGVWAINVSGNWRVTFRLHDGEVFDVDYEDYH